MGEDAQHEEQHHALEQGLVELARMAGERPAIGELDRPRHIGRSAPEFGIDEVGDAHQAEADRHAGGHDIEQRPGADAALDGKQRMARVTPSRPPWNDMPPCQTAKMSSGWAM